jgi:Retrotransposon gag protein
VEFFPTNEDELTRNNLCCLTQGRQSTEKYAVAFNDLASRSHYDAITLVELFRNGLRPDLRNTIMVNRDKLPDTLKEWQERATHLDRNRQMNDFDNTLRSGHGNFLYPDDIIRGNQPSPSRSGFQFQGCSIWSAEFPDHPEEVSA